MDYNYDENNLEYDGFIFLLSFAKTFWELDPEEAYQYVNGLLLWALYRQKIPYDQLPKCVRIGLINAYATIEASQDKYRIAKGNGAKGGRPKKEAQRNDQAD